MALYAESSPNKTHQYSDCVVSNSDDSITNKKNISSPSISSLYCLKALGAFLVICVHSYDPWIIYPIIRTAVPFFFIISGYFLYKEDSIQALSKCVSTFKKIFWLTLYSNIFYYLCFHVPNDIIPFKTIKHIILYIGAGQGMSGHLWYLNAYLEALFIIIISLKFKILKLVWCCIPIGIVFGLLVGKYEFLFRSLPNFVLLSRNFFTIGIPCIGIGWLLKKYYFKLSRMISYPISLVITLSILSEIEMIILYHNNIHILSGDCIITTIPLAASIVFVCIKYPSFGTNTVIERIGKQYSTNIYVFHMIILKIFLILIRDMLNLPSFTFPFIIFIITIIFIKIWGKCSKIIFCSD